MTDPTFGISFSDPKNLVESYGKVFEEKSFFSSDELKIVQELLSKVYATTVYGDSESLFVPHNHELSELIKLVIRSDKCLLQFIRYYYEVRTHVQSVIERDSLSRELSSVGNLLHELVDEKKNVNEYWKQSVEKFSGFMRWDSTSGDEIAAIYEQTKEAEFIVANVPSIDMSNYNSSISTLLIWLTHAAPISTESILCVARAFSDTNQKIFDEASCMDSVRFAFNWLKLHLIWFMRICVIQFRICMRLRVSGVTQSLKLADPEEPKTRFLDLHRLFSAFGMEESTEIFEYIEELDLKSYFKVDCLGTTTFKFKRMNVMEHNWPIVLLGCFSEQDVKCNASTILEIIESINARNLKTRLKYLYDSCLNETEFNPKFEESSQVATVEPVLVYTESIITTTSPEDTDLSFSMAPGWDIEEILADDPENLSKE